MPKEVVYKPQQKYNKKHYTPGIQKKELFPFIAGILTYGVRKIKFVEITGGTLAIYSVPKNKIFFLLSSSMFVRNNGVGFTKAAIFVEGEGGDIETILPASADLITTNTTNSVSYPFPLKFLEGETIELFISGDPGRTRGQITGYEVDTTLIPQLFV